MPVTVPRLPSGFAQERSNGSRFVQDGTIPAAPQSAQIIETRTSPWRTPTPFTFNQTQVQQWGRLTNADFLGVSCRLWPPQDRDPRVCMPNSSLTRFLR